MSTTDSQLPALIPDFRNSPECDYLLVAGSCWVRVEGLSVYIQKTEEGLSVEVFRAESPDHPIDTAFVKF